jgi:hypothetical protein
VSSRPHPKGFDPDSVMTVSVARWNATQETLQDQETEIRELRNDLRLADAERNKLRARTEAEYAVLDAVADWTLAMGSADVWHKVSHLMVVGRTYVENRG